MKNILVPTDFSKEAVYALDFAFKLAKKEKAKIYILNAIEIPMSAIVNPIGPPHVNGWSADFLDEMKKTREDKLKELLEHYEDTVPIEYKIELGYMLPATLEYIDRNNIDLVVMGTKGTSGLKEILVGSNAEKVVRYASCPVITMSHSSSPDDLNDIIFGLDLSGNEKNVVPDLKAFQRLLGFKIHFVHIATPHLIENEERDMAKMLLFCRENEFENYSLSVRKSFQREYGIIEFATEIGGDMIVMASSHRKGLAHFFVGSLAEDLANHSPMPVLTFSLEDKLKADMDKRSEMTLSIVE